MKIKTNMKSIISFLCIGLVLFGLLASSMYIPLNVNALGLDDVNAETTIVTFEDIPDYFRFNSPTTIVTAEDGSITVEEGIGIDGSFAMKRKLVNENNGDNKYQALYEGNNPIKITENTVYMVRLRYYVEIPGDSLNIDIRTGLNGNFFYNPQTMVSEQLHLSAAGEWKTKTLFFTAPSSFKTDKKGELCNSLFIGVHGKGNSVIYIDNIEVTKLWNKSSDYGAVYVDAGTYEESELVIGKVNDSVDIKPLQCEGKQFVGWYSDELLSKKTDAPSKISSGVKHIWARWYEGTKTVTFDDMPAALITNSATTLVTTEGYGIAENLGNDNSAVLKRENPADSHPREQALNYKNGYFVLKSNTTYKISFEYYIASGNNQAYLNFATARAGNMYYNRKYWIKDLMLETKKGVWFRNELVFTTNDIGIQNCAYIGVSGDVKTTVYIDNVCITELAPDDVLLEYRAPSLGLKKYVIGKKNEEIKDAPDMTNRNYDFGGWFTDAELTKPFENKLFPETSMVIYADVKWKDVLSVGFEDYPFAGTNEITGQFSGTVYEIADNNSSDGDGYSLKFDNSRAGQSRYEVPFLLNIGEEAMLVDNNTKYLITFDYYFENATNNDFYFIFATADPKNRWNRSVKFSNQFIGKDGNYKHKTWLTASCYGTTQVREEMNALVAYVQIPRSSILYIDNVRVQKIAEDESVLLYSSDCSNSPEPAIVKKGSTVDVADFKPYLPSGKSFIGYYKGEEQYIGNTVTVNEDTVLSAKTTTISMSEGFEETSYLLRGINGFGYDYDIEIYDSVRGSNASNAKNGRYSLHRIGAEPTFKSYSLHGNGYMSMYILEEFKKYTLTYSIKVENASHSKGAIGIRSLTSPCDPWTFTGYEIYTAAISDIADGNWHTVTHTFVSTSPYLAIITPGNLSIYIDDISIVVADENAVISPDVVYEEYLPELSSKNTNVSEDILEEFVLVYPEETITNNDDNEEDKSDSNSENDTDKETISNKPSIVEPESKNEINWIIISAVVLGMAAVTVIVLLLIKHRRKKI